jgi:hypothetical protein
MRAQTGEICRRAPCRSIPPTRPFPLPRRHFRALPRRRVPDRTALARSGAARVRRSGRSRAAAAGRVGDDCQRCRGGAAGRDPDVGRWTSLRARPALTLAPPSGCRPHGGAGPSPEPRERDGRVPRRVGADAASARERSRLSPALRATVTRPRYPSPRRRWTEVDERTIAVPPDDGDAVREGGLRAVVAADSSAFPIFRPCNISPQVHPAIVYVVYARFRSSHPIVSPHHPYTSAPSSPSANRPRRGRGGRVHVEVDRVHESVSPVCRKCLREEGLRSGGSSRRARLLRNLFGITLAMGEARR